MNNLQIFNSPEAVLYQQVLRGVRMKGGKDYGKY